MSTPRRFPRAIVSINRAKMPPNQPKTVLKEFGPLSRQRLVPDTGLLVPEERQDIFGRMCPLALGVRRGRDNCRSTSVE
jgi:hypothetical protein